MKNRFCIVHKPKFTEQRDIDTWHKLEDYLDKQGDAIFLDLVIRCSTHNHPAGGEGFVKYCIKNGWLVKLKLDENTYTPWKALEGTRVIDNNDITWNRGI